MEFIFVQIIAILAMAAIAILLIVFGYKEFKYRKKVEFLTNLISKDYETDKLEIESFLK